MREEDGEEEIKTTRKEQWRWSELQGLELLVSSSDEANLPPSSSSSLNQTAPAIEETPSMEKDGATPPSVAFRELFRFADRLDYVLITIGTVGAIVHGTSLPLFLRFFADLVNSFGSNAHNLDKMSQEVLKVFIHALQILCFSVFRGQKLLFYICLFECLQYAFYFLVVGAAIWASSWAGKKVKEFVCLKE